MKAKHVQTSILPHIHPRTERALGVTECKRVSLREKDACGGYVGVNGLLQHHHKRPYVYSIPRTRLTRKHLHARHHGGGRHLPGRRAVSDADERVRLSLS